MYNKKILLVFALSATLFACGGDGDDKLAERVEDAADNRAAVFDEEAETMRERAEGLDDQADDIREEGEQRGDAIDAADLDADSISEARKSDMVSGAAPAVR